MKFLAFAIVLATSTASADPCPPTVQLDGDPALVAILDRELAERGIATTGPCLAYTARVERRGDELVISIANSSRSVRGVQTAAAVIESFVRDDVGAPLLAIRRIDAPARVHATPADQQPPHVEAEQPLTGWHVFGGLETSFANDHTRWMGISIGACRMIGRLCAAVRFRGNAVGNEQGIWDGTTRKSTELLVGFDIPFRLGRFLLSPGAAMGLGDIKTQSNEPTSASNNLRAQAHFVLSIPLTTKLAIDTSLAGTLGEQVHLEPGYMTTIEEPYAFLRFGLALRYGRR